MFSRIKITLSLLFLVTVLFSSLLTVSAQSVTAYDLINTVNTLRTSNGLVPYQIDPWLMAYAQEHSDYQAATNTSTHLHSDGLLPQQRGLQENVASGDEEFMTADLVVNVIWADSVHMKTMVGYSTGFIGAGVASDNGKLFLTIDVRPGDDSTTVTTVSPGTTIPIVPLETSIPRADGSIVHVVGYGQTLWSIALVYGVTTDDIRRLNNIADDSTAIYVDQVLLIRLDSQVTANQSGIPPASITLTLMYAIPPFTATPFPTATVTPSTLLASTLTEVPFVPGTVLARNKVLYVGVLLAIYVAVLLAVVKFGFRKYNQ